MTGSTCRLLKKGIAGLIGAAFLVSLSTAAATDSPPRIAIIIDDLGYQLAAGRRVVELPGPVACAVLPDTPRAALTQGADRNVIAVLVNPASKNPSKPGISPVK